MLLSQLASGCLIELLWASWAVIKLISAFLCKRSHVYTIMVWGRNLFFYIFGAYRLFWTNKAKQPLANSLIVKIKKKKVREFLELPSINHGNGAHEQVGLKL